MTAIRRTIVASLVLYLPPLVWAAGGIADTGDGGRTSTIVAQTAGIMTAGLFTVLALLLPGLSWYRGLCDGMASLILALAIALPFGLVGWLADGLEPDQAIHIVATALVGGGSLCLVTAALARRLSEHPLSGFVPRLFQAAGLLAVGVSLAGGPAW